MPVKLSAAILAALVLAGTAQARCHFLCSIRNPVITQEYKHHVRYCAETTRCEVRKANNGKSNSSENFSHSSSGVYPCVIHWTYNGLRWWRYHYLLGGSVNHVGFGPNGVHTCLPGQ